MTKYPQTLINVDLSGPVDVDQNSKIQEAVQSAEDQLGQRGRVLLRASGTQPLIRVMVEGQDETETTELADGIAEVVAAEALAS